MDRGLRAQLSPNEEISLFKIAAGSTDPDQIQPAHLERLRALQLVEVKDGKWHLTVMGETRMRLANDPAGRPHAPDDSLSAS